jgi:hypothetical protein
MKWKTKRMMLYAQFANDVIGTAGADTGLGGGTPVVATAAGSTIGVLQINQANDEVQWFIPMPYDLDTAAQVLGRVIFVHSSTDADTPVFTIKSKFHAKQATVVDFDTSEDQSIAFAAHTCSTTVESLEMTNWTDLGWDDSFVSGDAMVGIILIASNLGSASADEIELIGLELMYQVDAMDKRGRRKTTRSELMNQPV